MTKLTKSAVTALAISELQKLAEAFGIENATTGTKKVLIPLIVAEMEKLPDEAAPPAKNELRVFLNKKALAGFNTTGKGTTTIARFFAKYGGFADSTKDELILEINGQQIDFFAIRKKLNKLVTSMFISQTAHAVYNHETHKWVNENDEAVKEAVKFIREAMPMTYDGINNLLTMDVAQFRENLSKDEIFADFVQHAPKSENVTKMLTWD